MKKRRISVFRIIDHADRQKVVSWLHTVHQKDIRATGHFEKVLIFPADLDVAYVTVIAIAKSVDHCDIYEKENLPAIRKSFTDELVTPKRIEMLASYSTTAEAA